MENYHTIIGFIILNKDYPSFAKPYYVDCNGNCFIQKIENGFICKEYVDYEKVKNAEGIVLYHGINFLEKNFYKEEIYCFAFSKYDFCIGRKEEVANFLEKSYKKHKKEFKNPFIANEIVEFVANVKKEKLEYTK